MIMVREPGRRGLKPRRRKIDPVVAVSIAAGVAGVLLLGLSAWRIRARIISKAGKRSSPAGEGGWFGRG